jgi:hypothetical protein
MVFAGLLPRWRAGLETLVLEWVENALRSVKPQNSNIQPSDQPSNDPK